MPKEAEPVKKSPLSPNDYIDEVVWKIHKLHRVKKAPSMQEIFSSSLENTDILALSDWLTQAEFETERQVKLQEVANTFEDVLYGSADVNLVHKEAAKAVFDALYDGYINTSDNFVSGKVVSEIVDQDTLWLYPKAMRDLDKVILKDSYQ